MCTTNFIAQRLVRRGRLAGGFVVASDAAAAAAAGAVALCRLGRGSLVLGVAESGAARAPGRPSAASAAAFILFHRFPRARPLRPGKVAAFAFQPPVPLSAIACRSRASSSVVQLPTERTAAPPPAAAPGTPAVYGVYIVANEIYAPGCQNDLNVQG